MKTLYDSHYVALGFIVAHAVLASYYDFTTRIFIVEALLGIVSLSIFAWIDYSGYSWRSPLSKRPLNRVGTFD